MSYLLSSCNVQDTLLGVCIGVLFGQLPSFMTIVIVGQSVTDVCVPDTGLGSENTTKVEVDATPSPQEARRGGRA